MGCDIHFFAERKYINNYTIHNSDGTKEERVSTGWSKIGKVFKDRYYEPSKPISDYNEITTDNPYTGRNYTLFAFLADVRNYTEIESIDKARGVPQDISDDMKRIVDDYGSDGHSHSWFTLDELLKANWDYVVKRIARLTKKERALFKNTKRPPEYTFEVIDHSTIKEVEYWIYMHEACKEFMDSLLELRKYADREKLDYKDIRCVFFFDN